MAGAEDPPSRTRHLVGNVRGFETTTPTEYAVSSNFVVYRKGSERDEDGIVRQRRDVLRRTDTLADFELAPR